MNRKVKLGDVCDLSIGFVGTVTTQYEEGGVPFLRTLNIKPYRILDTDIKRITQEFHQTQKKSILRAGDIAMVHTGVPGICCVIPEQYDNSNCIDMIVIKTHKDVVNPHYLAAYMNTIGYKTIEKVQVGCIQKHFNLKDAIDLDIFLPDICIQDKIGVFAEIVNRKIENNKYINSELQAMARTIYDYWFLQFDFPNEEGKPYKSSGGKMVWNEELGREIPEGWRVGTFADIFEIGNGKDHKNLSDGEIPVYGSGGVMRYVDRELYRGESVLIPRKGTLNNIIYVNGAFWTVDTMYFTKMKVKHSAIFTYYSIKQYDFERMNTGTGVPSMTASIIYSLKTVIPEEDALRKFDDKMQDIYGMIWKKKKENRCLVSLRDFLLPLLMNGQVGFEK